jgi:ABC-type transport system involved in multi-copper enzyme maturation permease subunit
LSAEHEASDRPHSWLSNILQVESVLLFCAILVCLFGIMFSSNFSSPGDPLYERLGELTLAVIGVSLTYYFLVVWTEVVAVMFPSLELSFVSGAVEGNRDQKEFDDDGNVVEKEDVT